MDNKELEDKVELKLIDDSAKEAKIQELRKAHKARAATIAKQCAFKDTELSENGNQACLTVEMLFEEVTQEIALILPHDYRTALCLENLENACMWAKKSIRVQDLLLQQKDNDGTDSQHN